MFQAESDRKLKYMHAKTLTCLYTVPKTLTWNVSLGKAHAKQCTQPAQGYLQFARRLCRVRCTVCEGVLLREFGIRPLESFGGGK